MAEYKTELNLSSGNGNYVELDFITQDDNILLSSKTNSLFKGITLSDALVELKTAIDKFNEGVTE